MTLKQELDLLERQYESLYWHHLDLKKRFEKLQKLLKKSNNVRDNKTRR